MGADRTPGSVSTTLTLTGGFEVDVEVAFESATNLSLANVGISGVVINPLDTLLLDRLPAGLLSVPGAFPVIVNIEPPAGVAALDFNGIATITLRTENLPYYNGIRLRMYSAHDGGDFKDITNEVSEGSYRVRGSQGEFSEFLIVQDDRPNVDVVNLKLAALQARLLASVLSIDPVVYATLSGHLADVETDWLASQRANAVTDLDAFSAAVAAATALQIPDTWSANPGPVNVAGQLRSEALSLRFSLLDVPCPAAANYTDTDLDNVPDECDNCTLVANPSQCDTDGDGFGNLCDADLNNNGTVNFTDLGLLKSVYLTADPDADFNCNGVVNITDLGLLKTMMYSTPGPSGLVP